jgi:hypothetical protein
MAITIGVTEEKANESGTINSSRSVLKMHIKSIGESTGVLAFMLNFKHKEFIAEGNELRG